jgi:trigger factor
LNVKSYEAKEKSMGELTVEIAAAEFDEAVNSAYKKSRSKISVPGFRKGKAPRKIIESMYGASTFYDDAVEIIHPDAYSFGVKEKGLNPVGMPVVTGIDISDDKTVTITYSISLYPEVTLGQYKNLSAVKRNAEVSDEDIDKELETIRKRNSRIQTADRPSKEGDTVVIDFEGYIDGVPFEGGKGENYNLILGSKNFIKGFEEQIEGMSAGEERDINLEFPEDYTDEFAGKPVMFKVKVHEVKESVAPELDDEFAKDVSEFDTLEEYKNNLKEELLKKKNDEVDKEFEDKLLTQIIESMEGEIPDVMVEENMTSSIQNFNYSLATHGMDIDMYLNMMNIDMAAFRENMRPSSEKQIKISVALEKIADLENIEATEEDMESGYEKLAKRHNMDIEQIKKGINSSVVEHEMRVSKAADLVFDTATALEAEPDEAEADSEKQDADTDAGEKAEKKPAAKKTEKAPAKKTARPAAKKAETKAEKEGEKAEKKDEETVKE